jgi:hypothetical protein
MKGGMEENMVVGAMDFNIRRATTWLSLGSLSRLTKAYTNAGSASLLAWSTSAL